jgi:hypothetical protein
MKIRLICSIALGVAVATGLSAQSANPAPPTGQSTAPGPAPGTAPGMGWRAGARGRTAETGMGGRGVAGTVIAMVPGGYTVRTDAGKIFRVQLSASTGFVKQTVQSGSEKNQGGRKPAPEAIKPGEIKVGDDIAAFGEVSQTANLVQAALVMLIDPERARLMHEWRVDFGKTWLMGRVTAIDESKFTLLGADSTSHEFKTVEATSFSKQRQAVSLADIRVEDVVRVEGALKDGSFVAASVTVMSMSVEKPPVVPREATPAPEANAKQAK